MEINSVPMDTSTEDAKAAVLRRIVDLRDTYKYKRTSMYFKPFKEEAILLTHVMSVLNMLTPWVYTIRNDAKTRCGVPDITICFLGKFIAFELKDDTGKATMPQKKHIASIVAAGGIAITLTTLKQLFDTLILSLE